MVARELADGRRVAELLASELTGRERGRLAALSLAAVDPDVEPTDAGAHAYDVVRDGELLAAVFVSPARARVEFSVGLEDAKRRADAVGLRARPRDATPPSLVVFVENGAHAKRVLDVFEAACESGGADASEQYV